MNKQPIWIKTDTASIMFSALTTKRWGRTFRFTAELDAPIDPALLRQAACDVLPSYPSAQTDLRNGFFWAYQRISPAQPIIRAESARPLLPVTALYKRLPGLRFTFRDDCVSMEASHTVGDGRGCIRIFEEVLSRYTAIKNGETVPYSPFAVPAVTCEDAFDTYYAPYGDTESVSRQKAYHFPERFARDYLKLQFAETSASAVKAVAHSSGMTVTEYLGAVLIFAVVRSAAAPIRQPITVAVPVDLRRFFPSGTLRNFTIQSYIRFDPRGRTDVSLDTVIRETACQLRDSLNPESLRKTVNKYGALKRNPVLRAVPYIIKKPALAYLQKKSHAEVTTIFTNLGERVLSPTLAPHVRRLQFVNGDTRRYGLPVTCSCVTFRDRLSLCFSAANRDTAWFDACVQILRDEGLAVDTASSEGTEKPDRPVKPKAARLPFIQWLRAYFNI